MRKEMNAATQLSAHATQTVYPLQEACFILSLYRNGNNDAPQRVGRHKAFHNHDLTVHSFEQVLGKRTEERIDNRSLAVQTNNDFGGIVFLHRMYDT